MQFSTRFILKAWLMVLGLGLPALTVAQELSTPEAANSLPIPFASAHPDKIKIPSAPDAWGGPRTDDDVTLSDRVTSYTIAATLDPEAHTVDATEQMTWRNRSKIPVSKVYFHLYLNAFENTGSTFFTERRMLSGSGGSRGEATLKEDEWGYIALDQVQQEGQDVIWRYVHPDNGPEADHTVVEFDLPSPVPPGGTLKLDINFQAKLPRVVLRTGYFGNFHLVAQWFPKIGVLELPGERGATQVRWNVHEFHYHSEFYADYGSYDVRLTVPENYVVGAVGVQQGAPVIHDGMATFHFIQHDVPDFAWMAAPDYKSITTTWTGPGSPEVTVKVLYPPEYVASAEPVMQATLDSLDYFSKTLGAYPYQTVTAVVPPYNAAEAGGMEYPTFFTSEGLEEVTPGTVSQYAIDFVTIHEFGHGYFMGLLGSNEFEEPMLDEGMNEYWDDRMLVGRQQMIHPVTPLLRWLGFDAAINPFVMERVRGVLGIGFPADALADNSWDRISNRSYGSVYSRTASAMHTLENLLGQELMGRAMQAYYQRWKFRHPSVADLRAVLQEVSGKPDIVDSIFSSQVYGTQRVDYRVVNIDNIELHPRAGTHVEDGARVTRTAEEVEKTIAAAREAWDKEHPDAEYGGPYQWRSYVTVKRDGSPLPVTLKVTFADDSTETVQWNDGSRWKRFTWVRPVKVISAEIDPAQNNYLDVNKLNDSYAVAADSSASRRWAADFAALVESVYTFLVTL